MPQCELVRSRKCRRNIDFCVACVNAWAEGADDCELSGIRLVTVESADLAKSLDLQLYFPISPCCGVRDPFHTPKMERPIMPEHNSSAVVEHVR